MSKEPKQDDELNTLLEGAVDAGTLSESSRSMLTGHLGELVIAGAAGTAMEDIVATDVTLITLLLDASSSIPARNLEQAIRDGQNQMLDAFQGSKEKENLLIAQWTFNHRLDVLHSYVPVEQATRLDARSYQGTGGTALYDTWCDGLTSNVAYAQRLRESGTPCRSLVVVLTDGEDTSSQRRSVGDCARLSKDLLASEQFVLAFVGVGDDVDFEQVARQMGVPDHAIAIQKDATPSGLRKLFQMVSRSAIRASQARIAPGAAGFFV